MSVTYKDIDLLSQKASLAGTEKIEVSDTNYITPDQIAAHKRVHLEDESDLPATPDSDTLYLIDDDGSGGSSNIVHLEDESELPASPDPDTLYVIDESGSTAYESVANKVTTMSASSTNEEYPSAKCVYDFVKPNMASSQPSGGMNPGPLYNLGTLSGAVTISFASPSDSSVENEYKFTFDSGSTAAVPTWPVSITSWAGNCVTSNQPVISASKHYEVSVVGGYGIIVEF